MKRITITFILLLFIIDLSGQHFDPIFNQPIERTWRDSGYYFQIEITDWIVNRLGPESSGIVSTKVSFRSSDESALMFFGRAVFFASTEDLPNNFEFEVGDRGRATIFFPQDLLFCPSPEQEQGMGQDDPYFPLYLSGRIDRIGTMDLNDPVPISVQLNVFQVN